MRAATPAAAMNHQASTRRRRSSGDRGTGTAIDEPPVQSVKAKALPKHLWYARLHLEWRMRRMLLPAMNFLVIVTLFMLSLSIERPVRAMNEIKENFKFHFNLEEVSEINTFRGMFPNQCLH